MGISSHVVLTKAPPGNYMNDYVALPSDYGSDAYYSRQDVKNIIETVHSNLSSLNERTGFTGDLYTRKVIIKPNLVSVFHDMGFRERDYPESTDPRVLDAVILFVKEYTSRIVIVESSGRGMPTRASFKISGIDRIARHHGTGLISLEEQPADRYFLPRARVMKEIIIPRIFSEVVNGEAFYISVPKMKTNLYTDVTLGFKNAMGTIPYNLRQRNHNYDLDQKLVDMLYLFKADMVIIDGIVGGQGNCPAPVQPVQSGVIISGNNSVETDRVATRMMGFDPEQVKLMKLSAEAGFGDPDVDVSGEQTVVPFKKADPSLMNEEFFRRFPNVRVLIGHTLESSPVIDDQGAVDHACMLEMELSCRGGCLATTRLGFDFLYFEGVDTGFALTLIIGKGVPVNGETFYFDRQGSPFTIDDIKDIKGKKLAVGTCAAALMPLVDEYIPGCMPMPNAPHMALHRLSGTGCRIMGMRNRNFLTLVRAIFKMHRERRRQIRAGNYIDCPGPVHGSPSEPPSLEGGGDYVDWDFPVMTGAEKRRLLRESWHELFTAAK